MARGILYFEEKDQFMHWSTIVDAPVTYLMSEDKFREWYQYEFGRQGMEGLDAKLEEARRTGCNWAGYSLDDVISCNRAGENETNITREEIVERYREDGNGGG